MKWVALIQIPITVFKILAIISTSGTIIYYGGGILARLGHQSGLYGEGFIRVGTLETDCETDGNNDSIDSDTNAVYYGGGVGLGYQFRDAKKAHLLDVFTSYSWVRLQEEDEVIDGMDYQFDSVDSSQVWNGALYTYRPNEHFSPYIGAAWEYEFKGDAKATVRKAYDVTTHSLEGSSGIFASLVSSYEHYGRLALCTQICSMITIPIWRLSRMNKKINIKGTFL